MTALDPADFDEWYESIAASSRWDELVRQWLDLPATLESTGYLSGSGLQEVRDQLALTTDSTWSSSAVAVPGTGWRWSRRRGHD